MYVCMFTMRIGLTGKMTRPMCKVRLNPTNLLLHKE